MSLDKRYLTAFLAPDKFNVGGFELDAFNIRHAITLEALKSPILTGNKSASVYDLIVALRVCSTKNWKDAFKPLGFFEKMKYEKLYLNIPLQARVVTDFKVYISDCLSVPKLWRKDGNTTINNKEPMPANLVSVVFLMSRLGFSEKDAWNMPIGKAMWYSIAYNFLEGDEINTITTEDEENELKDKELLIELEKKMKESLKAKK